MLLNPTHAPRMIKALTIALLITLAWPLPAMITFSNPTEGVVLGRYAPTYAALLGGYLLAVIGWMVITIVMLARLTSERLAAWQAFLEQHIGPFVIAALIPPVILISTRCLMLSTELVLPSTVSTILNVSLALLVAEWCGLVALIAGAGMGQRMEAALHQISDPMAARLQILTRGRAGQAITGISLAVLLGMLIFPVIGRKFWNFPLTVDGGTHVYVGRRMLLGSLPYHDLLLPYPPLRYAVSLLWSISAQILGLPVVVAARIVNLIASAGVMLMAYLIGREMTGRQIGGLLAAVLLMGTELVLDVTIGPLVRPILAVIAMLSLWMAQRKRWFAAGALASAATLIYAPMGLVAVGLVIAALIQDESPRLRAAGCTIAGGSLILGIVIAGLAALGLLTDAYNASVLPTVEYVIRRAAFLLSRMGDPSASSLLDKEGLVLAWALRGDWEVGALMGLGVVALVLPDGRTRLRDPRVIGLLIPTVLFTLSVFLDDGGPDDTMLRVMLLAAFGADILIRAARLLAGKFGMLQTSLATAMLIAVFAIGRADAAAQREYEYSLAQVTLSQQQAMADQLHNALQPGETVFSLIDVWYLALTGSPNAVPIRRFDLTIDALQGTVWTPDYILKTLDANKPVVIMWLGDKPDGYSAWISTNYTLMGTLDSESKNRPQAIYVLTSRPDIQNLIAGWPLEKP